MNTKYCVSIALLIVAFHYLTGCNTLVAVEDCGQSFSQSVFIHEPLTNEQYFTFTQSGYRYFTISNLVENVCSDAEVTVAYSVGIMDGVSHPLPVKLYGVTDSGLSFRDTLVLYEGMAHVQLETLEYGESINLHQYFQGGTAWFESRTFVGFETTGVWSQDSLYFVTHFNLMGTTAEGYRAK